MSAPRARPRKECQDCPGRAACIAKVEMVSAGIIKIDCALDQTQPEQSDVKIQVALRVTGDGGNMMNDRRFFCPWASSRIQVDFICRSTLPIKTNATIALATASVAPVAMTTRKASTKDSAIA